MNIFWLLVAGCGEEGGGGGLLHDALQNSRHLGRVRVTLIVVWITITSSISGGRAIDNDCDYDKLGTNRPKGDIS